MHLVVRLSELGPWSYDSAFFQPPLCHQLWQSHWVYDQNIGSSLPWKTSPATVTPKASLCIYSGWICIECCQEWWRLIQLLMPMSFLTITNCHNTSICNQVSYVIWHLTMIGFTYYSFVKVCGVKTYAQFQIPDLSLLLTKTKLFIQGVASVTGLSTPPWSILSISFLKLYLSELALADKGFILVEHWVQMYGVWRSQKLPIPSKTFGYCAIIWSLLVINLLFCCCLFWFISTCCLLWGGHLLWSMYMLLSLPGFLGWCCVLVIKLALGGK